MARSISVSHEQSKRSRRATAATLPLTLWQLRQTWRLLLITGIGMLCAVVLVCAGPLYSQVAITAELRDFFYAQPSTSPITNADIQIKSTLSSQATLTDIPLVSPAAMHDATDQINQIVRQKLGSFVHEPVHISIDAPGFMIMQQTQTGFTATLNSFELLGESMQTARTHLQMLQGRLPQENSTQLEIAITQQEADLLHLVPGGTIPVQVFQQRSNAKIFPPDLLLHVVGIFAPHTNDYYWHSENFLASGDTTSTQFTGLMANSTYMSLFSSPHFNQKQFLDPSSIDWYYHIDADRLDSNQLNAVVTGLNNVLIHTSNNPVIPPYIYRTISFSPGADALTTYRNRLAVIQIPVLSLSVLVVALILFFVSMMMDILIDRQVDAIALLRSRGASRGQLLSSLLAQAVLLALIALGIGPFLAMGLVQLLVKFSLPVGEQGALNMLSFDQRAIIQELLEIAGVTVLIAVIVMAFSAFRSTNASVLSMRREAARSTNRPIWQRLSLDVVAAIIAMAIFGIASYITSPGVLDIRVSTLIQPPITLIGVIFLLLGITLLFLRFFPTLLQLFARFATRGRSATPMLALAQMARAPRQSIRMTMLLAFAIAFAIFTLVFTSSEAQRIIDVTNYQVGTDFSGQIPGSGIIARSSTYQHIPGVLSATVGTTSLPRASQGSLNYSVSLQAVDADTYAQTVIWSDQYSSQSISSLMHMLVARRQDAENQSLVPAIVDTVGWTALHLTPGQQFSLSDTNGTVNCIAVAEVNYIPTINDSLLSNGSDGTFSTGGILVDYQTYERVALKANNIDIPTHNVWLRSKDDPKSLADVRHELNLGTLQLTSLDDRRQIISNLQNDPLYKDLIGILLLGAVVAMLLALVGNLIASWLSVRTRLTGFAVLRALGTSPRQIAGILTWEQCIIYLTALVLGIVFGAVLTVLTVPQLVFTNVAISGLHSEIDITEFYILQSLPPAQIIFSSWLPVAFGVLIVICIIALSMMVSIASKPSISQTLRLNED